MVSLLLALALPFSAPVSNHGRASLLSETRSAPLAGALSLALHLELDSGWHAYWRNPGAAGLPLSLELQSPSTARLDSLQWPVPALIPVPPLMTYGYSDSVTFPFSAQVAGRIGDTLHLEIKAKWQVCKEICLLETQDLSLSLPFAATAESDPAVSARLAAARDRVPPRLLPSGLRVALGDSLLVLSLPGKPPASVRLFPIDPMVLDDAAPQDLQALHDGFRLTVPRDPFQRDKRPDSLGFVLVSDGRAFEARVPLVALAPSDTAAPVPPSPATPLARLLTALALAFLGGLLLNLMPCVLPVLSLKVLDLLKHSGQSRHRAMLHGASYAAGVILSFLALAILLLSLRAGGAALGWGFQLQSPPVVALLSGLMLLVACNLWGLFEPGSSLARLDGSHRASGLVGSFLTGLAATVVATPCTAPFMGAALGYTLSRPAFEALLVFASLGLGLAAPVVAITAVPHLGRLLPRPGAWMETLKQALGFGMAATAAWLGWLLTRLSGTDGLLALFGLWLLVGMAAWILGRWAVPHHTNRTRIVARLAALALLAGGVGLAVPIRPAAAITPTSASEELWRSGLTEELRASGKPWFLHFTADWCLSCQVNERNAFRDERVEQAFRERGIRRVKADWTARDSGIANELARWERQGIPFYVLSDGRTETVLPEVVTPGIVLETLERIPKTR